MILEAAIGVALATAAGIGVRWVRHRWPQKGRSQSPALDVPKETIRMPGELAIGDVIVRNMPGESTADLWLCGSLRLEAGTRSVEVFRVGEHGRRRWVLARRSGLVLLEENTEIGTSEPPQQLPIRGRILSLIQRSRGAVSTSGEQVPALSGSATLSILADDAGLVAMVLCPDHGRSIGWLGSVMAPEQLEVLRGAGAGASRAER